MEISKFLNENMKNYKITLKLLLKIFEKYGNINKPKYSIEKDKIEQILSILCIELYYPNTILFESKKEIIYYYEIVEKLHFLFKSK